MPETAAAFAAGDIGVMRVRGLVGAREAAPECFAAAEAMLVGQARGLEARDFAAAVEMWRHRVAPAVTATEERDRFERRRLSITDSFDGMVHLEGDLDPVSGEVIITAIGSLAGPANRDGGDGRTPTQRRVDAITEICRNHLDSGEAPVAGGQKPHLHVIVDYQTLYGEAPGGGEVGDRRVIGPAAIEFFACDTIACRVVTNGSHILDMGRQVRTATPAQLRALAIRDGGCVVPGCGRPPSWCDAHHLLLWVEGGLTNIDEMRLLCRPHHLMLHLGILQLE
jgi:hypothetical protein